MRQLEIIAPFLLLSFALMGSSIERQHLIKLESSRQVIDDSAGLYVHIVPRAFVDPSTMNMPVRVDLFDDETKRILTFFHQPGSNSRGNIKEIWMIKPGLYRLVRIKYGQRTWKQFKNAKLILARAGQLSNLGSWALAAANEKKLRLKFHRTSTKFDFSKHTSAPFQAVIDGFNGKVQVAKPGSQDRFSARGPGGGLVKTLSYVRSIALTYDLKINGAQHQAQALLNRINKSGKNFQNCYTDQVTGQAYGSIRFRFAIDTDKQRIDKARLEHSDLRHRPLENCLNNHLNQVSYAPDKNLVGTISFNFQVSHQSL